jgi:hypothetical protein
LRGCGFWLKNTAFIQKAQKQKSKIRRHIMDEFYKQIATLGATILTIAIGWFIAWVRGKIASGKLVNLQPLNDLLDKELPKYFMPVLQNIFQKYIKPIYKTDAWTKEKQTEVFNQAFDDLIKLLPDFVIKLAKSIKADWEDMLRTRLAAFLELNKDNINTNTPKVIDTEALKAQAAAVQSQTNLETR